MKKKHLGIFLILISLGFISTNLAAEKYNMQVIMIGIGSKNATFDEARFPHLKFFYTPELISQAKLNEDGKSALSLFGGKAARESFKGAPELLVKWWDERDLRDYAVLFDKNGVGCWQGSIFRDDDDLLASKGKGDEKELEDALEKFVLDAKDADYDAKKKFEADEDDNLLEMKMPDFEVVTLDSQKVSIKSLIETGKPTFVVFFQISSNVNLKEAKESGAGKSTGGFMSSMIKGAAASKWDAHFIQLESQLFGYDAREK